MKVPLLDLKAQYATIKDEILPVVLAVMDSQWFIHGPSVKELEKLIASYSGCAAGVGVSSGTDALLCSLMALGVGPGDEVITTPFTFFATVGSIWRTGAKPVFADIEPDTFNIDPAKITAAVTDKTKAIIPVHLFGQMARMDPIMALADAHGLAVVEDAAQSIGATHKGLKAGSIGTTGCFSFYPSKNLSGLGDGGMIVTQSEALAKQLATLRNHGQTSTYKHKWVGGNFRLDSLSAAALVVKLAHLDEWSAKRRANAARYDKLFAGFDAIRTPTVRQGNVSVHNQYVIRVPQRRDELKDFLTSHDIHTAVYYPLCLHEQECFASLGYKRGDFPISEQAADEVLALPIYPELTDEQIKFVADKTMEFLA
ncbi:MAG: DegT/DnrJ/EryC1/StrS family aminotransferase [Planctomycetes bacterium]|nr:DegT/DnrJ/EryC1/StrS family aminotransferase [Planctomycetota bacterium]